jgi:hypothetical protein
VENWTISKIFRVLESILVEEFFSASTLSSQQRILVVYFLTIGYPFWSPIVRRIVTVMLLVSTSTSHVRKTSIVDVI